MPVEVNERDVVCEVVELEVTDSVVVPVVLGLVVEVVVAVGDELAVVVVDMVVVMEGVDEMEGEEVGLVLEVTVWVMCRGLQRLRVHTDDRTRAHWKHMETHVFM